MACEGLERSILEDNEDIYKLNSGEEKCKSCYYKIAFAVWLDINGLFLTTYPHRLTLAPAFSIFF